MGSLYTKNSIKCILVNNKEIDWQSIVIEIFNDTQYRFYLNSELIDVDDRFRMVKLNNKTYIIKKTSVDKAKKEVKNAIILSDRLNKTIIDGYKIKPLIPISIIDGSNGYIISEYKGCTLQEYLYDKRKTNIIPLSVFIKIVNYLFDKKIIYRGFIPRNVILKNKTIYMIDFEDITFNDNIDPVRLNLQFLTNFILNWQYFYKKQSLSQMLEKYKFSDEEKIELLAFENCYKLITGCKCNNRDLRIKVFNTVIYAEKPCNIRKSIYYKIMPTDLVHLLSDLFGYYLDVVVDLFFENIRKKDELSFYNFISYSSDIIKSHYCNLLKLRQELFILLIKSIKIIGNKKQINKTEIKSINMNKNDIAALVDSFFKIIESKTNESIKQQLVDMITCIGGEYELF